MVPEILIRTPDGASKAVRLEKSRVTLGRSATNELCYPEDHGLSRQHLAFEREGRGWLVCDLGSKNGTLVNGIRVQSPTKVEPGDRITAGHLIISFADQESGPANETVVFVDTTSSSSSSTLITSLDRVLSKPDTTSSRASLTSEGIHAQALAEASRQLASNRSVADLCKTIMDQSLDAVGATRGVLMTLEAGQLVVKETRGEGFKISSHIRDRVVKDKESLLVRDTHLDDLFNKQVSIVENKVRSFMAVPLQTSEKVIGLLYLDSSMIREFSKDDLNLVTVMANIAAIRIENARLAEVEREEQITRKELEQAADLQRRLLPTKSPEVPGVDLAGYNVPCRTVGGDYYDFFSYPDGRVAVIVADVAGKGMPAAMLMSSLQARVQVLAEDSLDVAQLVARLNRAICINTPQNKFITFFMAILDTKTGEMAYCNAGHNPPILARAAGPVETLEGGGLVLGILPNAAYTARSTQLDPGDTLVLFSDGVTEAACPGSMEEYGEDRLQDLIGANRQQGAAELIETINQSVDIWAAGAPPVDDVTLVVARRLDHSIG